MKLMVEKQLSVFGLMVEETERSRKVNAVYLAGIKNNNIYFLLFTTYQVLPNTPSSASL